MRIGNGCGKCRRAERPDARDGHQTTCNLVASQQNGQIAIDLAKPNMDLERLL
jgi:hypothetical protein